VALHANVECQMVCRCSMTGIASASGEGDEGKYVVQTIAPGMQWLAALYLHEFHLEECRRLLLCWQATLIRYPEGLNSLNNGKQG
jgi:hypothetical protein